MEEIMIRFESTEDAVRFINQVCLPSVNDGKAEFDSENKILIVKDTQINNGNTN